MPGHILHCNTAFCFLSFLQVWFWWSVCTPGDPYYWVLPWLYLQYSFLLAIVGTKSGSCRWDKEVWMEMLFFWPLNKDLWYEKNNPCSINELGGSPAFKAHQKNLQCAFLHLWPLWCLVSTWHSFDPLHVDQNFVSYKDIVTSNYIHGRESCEKTRLKMDFRLAGF